MPKLHQPRFMANLCRNVAVFLPSITNLHQNYYGLRFTFPNHKSIFEEFERTNASLVSATDRREAGGALIAVIYNRTFYAVQLQ